MQPKCIQVTHGTKQKFKFEIHQYLIHTWHGSEVHNWRSNLHVPKYTSQPPDRSALTLLSLPSWSGKGAP